MSYSVFWNILVRYYVIRYTVAPEDGFGQVQKIFFMHRRRGRAVEQSNSRFPSKSQGNRMANSVYIYIFNICSSFLHNINFTPDHNEPFASFRFCPSRIISLIQIGPYQTICHIQVGPYKSLVLLYARQESLLICQIIEPFTEKLRWKLMSGCIQHI